VRAAAGGWSPAVRIGSTAPDDVAFGPGNVALVDTFPGSISSVNDTVRAISGTWQAP
jgi:hypothetical protein